MVWRSVRSITRRSMPRPRPPVGGMPYSRAARNSSSIGWASSSPAARSAAAMAKRSRWSSGSFSSVKALPISMPPGERLEALDDRRVVGAALGEGRELERVVVEDRGLDQGRLEGLREQPVDQLGPGGAVGRVEARARASRRAGPPRRCGRARRRRSPGGARRGSRGGATAARARSRRPSTSTAVDPVASRAAVETICSSIAIDVAVVGEGLVGLDHRELGVVLVADALVAEVLARARRPSRGRPRCSA